MPGSPVLDEYRRMFPQPCANFEADGTLDPAMRQRFLQHVEGFQGGDLQEHMNIFFHDSSNKRLGPQVELEAGEILGAVRTTSSFARPFTEVNRFDQDPIDAEEFVRDLTFLSAEALGLTLRTLFNPAATITPHLMWSYRNPPHFRDPFETVELSDLACRLGLPTYPHEHVAFGHSPVPDTTIPTCFDAGLIEEWRPGGTTKPLSSCGDRYPLGLPEVVHEPNVFHHIVTALHLV